MVGRRNFVPLLYGLWSVGLLAPVLCLRLQHTLDPWWAFIHRADLQTFCQLLEIAENPEGWKPKGTEHRHSPHLQDSLTQAEAEVQRVVGMETCQLWSGSPTQKRPSVLSVFLEPAQMDAWTPQGSNWDKWPFPTGIQRVFKVKEAQLSGHHTERLYKTWVSCFSSQAGTPKAACQNTDEQV